jgi:enoyl-CoA hydratase/carnithine racemase
MQDEGSSPAGGRVKIEIAEGVAEVTLNRPDKLNALDPAMFEAIIAAGESLSRTTGLRAVVLAGAGKGFCAGLDKETFAAMSAGGAPKLGDLAKRTHGLANAFQQAAYVWRTLPVPVIAAIHGVALGGGFQIALGADIRCVAPDARLAILEIKWGLVPDMGGIALMRELAPADVIRELAMTGRIFQRDGGLGLRLRHQPPRRPARRRALDRQGNRRPQPRRGARRQAPSQGGQRRRLGRDPAGRIEGAGGPHRLAEPDRSGASGNGRQGGAVQGAVNGEGGAPPALP